jgi:mono/diheme cytochrome c family protein
MLMLLSAVALRAQSPTSVKDGVYTAAQADRGEKVFKQSCASCHALEANGKVSGDAPGPDLAGEFFLTRESGNSAWTITKVIKDTMPNDFSMEMTEPIALDLTAYLLKVNKFPDGKAELTAETAKTAMIVK